MEWSDADSALEARAARLGLRLPQIRLGELVGLVIGWYLDERASGTAPVHHDGDMLLFQWGTWSWSEPPSFTIDMTRQFLVTAGDDEIWQLSVELQYPLTDVGPGHRWCGSPDEVDDFRAFIDGSEVMTRFGMVMPDRVDVGLEPAD
jgi:hypothetical protein